MNIKLLLKIISNIFIWIMVSAWLFLIWAGFPWASHIVVSIVILSIEGSRIYNNIKTKKSIWG
jgi:hypothetical protein